MRTVTLSMHSVTNNMMDAGLWSATAYMCSCGGSGKDMQLSKCLCCLEVVIEEDFSHDARNVYNNVIKCVCSDLLGLFKHTITRLFLYAVKAHLHKLVRRQKLM